MAYQYQVPQPPKSNTLRTVLIVVGSLLVLCCIVAVVGGYFLFRNSGKDIQQAQDTTDVFVTDLEQSKLDAAYGMLCDATKGQFTADAFTQFVGKQPVIKRHELAGTSVMNQMGRVTARVSVNLWLDTGSTSGHVFPLLKEGGTWKVCGNPL
ncbi:Rv0361 family membrane protein [Dactylosporangium sp. CA-139066]|uniref:Rv0361 family membrane protein n=1 Tax=Dactylosporangium sp. CA-139066 TaxID=3239930 RepID=UPI003D8F6FA6